MLQCVNLCGIPSSPKIFNSLNETVKPLGIHIDNMLQFTEHVTEVIRKCGFQLYKLWRHLKLFNNKKVTYFSFIHPDQPQLLPTDVDLQKSDRHETY